MSQKSSVPQAVSFVSQVLKRDTQLTRQSVDEYLKAAGKKPGDFMFSGRKGSDWSMTTRQYARLVSEWIASIRLDPHVFSTLRFAELRRR
jgi:hypothetical protein